MGLRQNVAMIAMAASAAMSVGNASAGELWDPHLRGADEGLASGASLPPGVYGVLDSYVVGFNQYDNKGDRTGVKLDAIVEIPIVLWQTGFQVLGADYAVGIAQPFDYTNLKVPGSAALSDNGHWGTYNTILIPGVLSWDLGDGLHLSSGLCVYVDDASSSPASPPSRGGVGSGNGYWSLQPDLGVSWLKDGWNLSVSAHYAYNFRDSKTDYTSGQELLVDYTATKTLDKWTLGVGAFSQTQLNADSGQGAVAKGCPAKDGCKVSLFGIGPLVGYQFGGLELMAEYNFSVVSENDVAGDILNIRLVAPL